VNKLTNLQLLEDIASNYIYANIKKKHLPYRMRVFLCHKQNLFIHTGIMNCIFHLEYPGLTFSSIH